MYTRKKGGLVGQGEDREENKVAKSYFSNKRREQDDDEKDKYECGALKPPKTHEFKQFYEFELRITIENVEKMKKDVVVI